MRRHAVHIVGAVRKTGEGFIRHKRRIDHLAVGVKLIGAGGQQIVGPPLGHIVATGHGLAQTIDVIIVAVHFDQAHMRRHAVHIVGAVRKTGEGFIRHKRRIDHLAVGVKLIGAGGQQIVGPPLGHIVATGRRFTGTGDVVVITIHLDQAGMHGFAVFNVIHIALTGRDQSGIGNIFDVLTVFIKPVCQRIGIRVVAIDFNHTVAG